jgi:hypothetical protein
LERVGKSDSDAGFALHGFFFYVSGADPITSIAPSATTAPRAAMRSPRRREA